jgi:hypothetical protein
MKYIKHYRAKKSSLKSETTKNESWHKILENILFFGSYKSSELNDTIILSAHRHIAVTMITLKVGIVLQPSLTQLLAALLGGTADCFVSLQWIDH